MHEHYEHRYIDIFIEPAADSVPNESANKLSIVLSTSKTEDFAFPKLALTLALAAPPDSLNVISVVRIPILDYLTDKAIIKL
jgi:hypothetical protein